MNKMVPKVMINMNEYIPSGILGKRVKLDFSKNHTAIISQKFEGINDQGSATAVISTLPQILNVNNEWEQVVSGIVSCIALGINSDGLVRLELSDCYNADNSETGFHSATNDQTTYGFMWVKLDQLAQNGGVSWYSKPLASVREAVAA